MWTMVVAVKALGIAKSRLAPEWDGQRSSLALAFASDTVGAALSCRLVDSVLVVTRDQTAARVLSALGAVVVPDDGVGGLNGAFEAGAREALRARRGTRPAALTADLPCLRPADLASALLAASAVDGRSFVPDAHGTGTTLLAAGRDGVLRPLFGAGSRAAHEESGAVALLDAGETLRHDVDTAADLRQAAGIGLGRHTLAAVTASTVRPPAPRPARRVSSFTGPRDPS